MGLVRFVILGSRDEWEFRDHESDTGDRQNGKHDHLLNRL
jgi:hypothetical protein